MLGATDPMGMGIRLVDILSSNIGLTLSTLRTTSLTNQTDESCIAMIDSMRGMCNEYGFELGIFGCSRDKFSWRRTINVCGIPTHNTEHRSGLQREKKVISCHV